MRRSLLKRTRISRLNLRLNHVSMVEQNVERLVNVRTISTPVRWWPNDDHIGVNRSFVLQRIYSTGSLWSSAVYCGATSTGCFVPTADGRVKLRRAYPMLRTGHSIRSAYPCALGWRHLRTMPAVRGENAVEASEVDPRFRHQADPSRNELSRPAQLPRQAPPQNRTCGTPVCANFGHSFQAQRISASSQELYYHRAS